MWLVCMFMSANCIHMPYYYKIATSAFHWPDGTGCTSHDKFKTNKTPAQGVRSAGKGEGQQQNCLGCMM